VQLPKLVAESLGEVLDVLLGDRVELDSRAHVPDSPTAPGDDVVTDR